MKNRKDKKFKIVNDDKWLYCNKCKTRTWHSTHGFEANNRRYVCLVCGLTIYEKYF